MRFKEPGGTVHLRCTSGMNTEAEDVLSFTYCINYDCLPPDFQDKTLNVTAEKLPIPGADDSTFGQNKTSTLVTFLVPPCATPSITAFKPDAAGELVILSAPPGEDDVFELPPAGIAALSIHALIEPSCNERFIAVVITSTYEQADQPLIPTSSCPCWGTPQDAEDPNELGCDGIGFPVTLETVPSARNDGVSFQQCIDPANYDFL